MAQKKKQKENNPSVWVYMHLPNNLLAIGVVGEQGTVEITDQNSAHSQQGRIPHSFYGVLLSLDFTLDRMCVLCVRVCVCVCVCVSCIKTSFPTTHSPYHNRFYTTSLFPRRSQ